MLLKNRLRRVLETKTENIIIITKCELSIVQCQTSEKPSAGRTTKASANEAGTATSFILSTFRRSSRHHSKNRCMLSIQSIKKHSKQDVNKAFQTITQSSQIGQLRRREKMIEGEEILVDATRDTSTDRLLVNQADTMTTVTAMTATEITVEVETVTTIAEIEIDMVTAPIAMAVVETTDKVKIEKTKDMGIMTTTDDKLEGTMMSPDVTKEKMMTTLMVKNVIDPTKSQDQDPSHQQEAGASHPELEERHPKIEEQRLPSGMKMILKAMISKTKRNQSKDLIENKKMIKLFTKEKQIET